MTLILKSTTVLFFLLLFSSCCTQKEMTKGESLKCQGVVHVSESGCPYYVEITQSTLDGIVVGSKIYPIELKDSYKKKGLKLAFNAIISRAPSPSDCTIDGVAALSDIVVVP